MTSKREENSYLVLRATIFTTGRICLRGTQQHCLQLCSRKKHRFCGLINTLTRTTITYNSKKRTKENPKERVLAEVESFWRRRIIPKSEHRSTNIPISSPPWRHLLLKMENYSCRASLESSALARHTIKATSRLLLTSSCFLRLRATWSSCSCQSQSSGRWCAKPKTSWTTRWLKWSLQDSFAVWYCTCSLQMSSKEASTSWNSRRTISIGS